MFNKKTTRVIKSFFSKNHITNNRVIVGGGGVRQTLNRRTIIQQDFPDHPMIPQNIPTHKPEIIRAVKEPSFKPIHIGDTKAVRLETEAFDIVRGFNQAENPILLGEMVNKAIKLFNEALSEQPHKLQIPFIYYGLGLCYIRLGDWVAAEKCYYKAVEEDVNFVPAYEGMGESYMMQDKWELALGWLTKFFDCFPEYYGAYAYYSDLFGITNLNSEDILSSTLFKRGLCYYKISDYVSAATDFNYLIELDHKHISQAFCYLGKIACARAKFWDALSLLNKSIERDPKNFIAYNERSDVWLALGKPEESDEDRRRYHLAKRERIMKKLEYINKR